MKVKAGDNIFRITKFQMLCTGNWPLTKHWPMRWQFYYKLYSYFANFVMYSSLPGSVTFFLVTLLVEKNSEKAVDLLSYMVITSLVNIKTFICNSKKMADLIEQAIQRGNDVSEVYTIVAKSYMKYITALNTFGFAVGAFLYIEYTVEAEMHIFKHMKAQNSSEDESDFLIHWHPFDTSNHFGLACYIEMLRGIYISMNNCLTQSVINTIMIHSAALFKVLNFNFQNFHYNNMGNQTVANQYKASKRLKKYIREHQAIIRYIEKFNKCIQYVLLLEYIVSSLMVASVLIQILKADRRLFDFVFAFILIAQLLVLCCNANEIPLQSINIALGIYESHWYRYDKEIQKMVHIIIMRAMKPVSLTIGPFGPLTAKTGLERLKLAYSFMSIMPGETM
uniref:Odorant receptor n=1 Tax=Eucryptorrhynchus scrobiculatus TaxID=1552824 RepID=A0A8F4MZU9_EUCSC|nr:odorant receptor 33 [Eucryptorrhynchus scrobiculatus]